MSHPLFSKVVSDAWLDDMVLKANIEKFTKDVQIWNKDVFGNIFHRKNIVEAKLRDIQISIVLNPNEQLLEFENKLRRESFDVLQQEEEFRSIKSRYNWLIQGDRNTKLFHTSTLIRRKRNRIVSFQDSQEVWFYNEDEIATLIRNRFQELFTFSAVSVLKGSWEIPSWSSHMSLEERIQVSREISIQEVKECLWSLKPFKAPGPDGLHTGFFQAYWNIVGSSVFEEVKEILRCGSMPDHLNETLITLISKCPGAATLGSFRPISLCNTIYKVVTKMIVMRLRPLLPNLISPLQTAFVPGRMGVDNMITAQELIHTMSLKKRRAGFMAIKIDLEKAYDKLEWHFIHDMLKLYKFPSHLIKLIMSCVSTSSITMLLNGGRLEPFLPSRAIRQGDPLSPYLFILCMEMLGFLILEKCSANLWDPMKASSNGPVFSHLFFADDLFLFAKADLKNCCNIRETLDTFCELSGQKVSFAKSKVYFSPNISPDCRNKMCEVLGFRSTPNLGKYLGLPLKHQGASSQDFNFVIERV